MTLILKTTGKPNRISESWASTFEVQRRPSCED